MKSLWQKDSVRIGLIIGFVLPALVYGVLFFIYMLLDEAGVLSDIGFAENFRTRTLGLISICSNLVIMQTRKRTHQNETIRGILIASMVLVLIWFFVFGIKILRF